MKSSQSHQGSAAKRFPSFSRAVSPIQYGVAAIIVQTLAYSCLHVIPMVRRDLGLLKELYTQDVEGVSLESDLQYEIQENRRGFLRLLLASGSPAQVNDELQLMRASDATIAQTQAAIARLGVIPEKSQNQFRQSWADYVVLRDRLLASGKAGDLIEARKIDPNLGRSAFLPVEQAAQNARSEFRENSAVHIQEISATLTGALREMVFLVGI